MEFAAPELARSSDCWQRIVKELRTRHLFNVGDKRISRHSVLFLDEIHHPEAQTLRSGLLRSMETDRIADGKVEVDTDLLTYLFAASKSPKQLREMHPFDFWTRIEYNIVLHHPLRLDERRERNDALRQYFCLFWRKTAEKWLKTAKEDNDDETKRYAEFLESEEALLDISNAFVDVLGSPLIPMISIRTIRSIVSRLFGRALYLAQTEQPAIGNLVESVIKYFDAWTTEICRQIVPELEPEGAF